MRHLVRLRNCANPRRNFATLRALPLKISRKQADNLVGEKYKSKSEAVRVKECYLPFYGSSACNLVSTYIGKRGVDTTSTYTMPVVVGKTITMQEYTDTTTKWYPVNGTLDKIDYSIDNKKTQKYAGFVYPPSIIEQKFQTHDVNNLKELSQVNTGKKFIFSYQMNMAHFKQLAESLFFTIEKDRAYQHIKSNNKADHVRIDQLDTDFKNANIMIIPYHIPAYIYQSTENPYNFNIVNGYSGDMVENHTASVATYSLVGTGVGGLVTYGVLASSMGPLSLAHIAIGSIGGGLFSSQIAVLKNYFGKKDFDNEKSLLIKENKKYMLCEEDKEIQKLIDEMNKKNSHY
ncbi:MAG: DnaJ-like subfamily C member 3 [Edafosvirus sp.]|uniref:DnaJ-like subfamily C member 3 n=1 Tax=Edafosvirus sp. TaxID=2487765 RepID=A0A3G4ZSZ8_9VIRU|nr:MAG: DnaJ-like subfamily C member 3 [Edafosvirus sp.]